MSKSIWRPADKTEIIANVENDRYQRVAHILSRSIKIDEGLNT